MTGTKTSGSREAGRIDAVPFLFVGTILRGRRPNIKAEAPLVLLSTFRSQLLGLIDPYLTGRGMDPELSMNPCASSVRPDRKLKDTDRGLRSDTLRPGRGVISPSLSNNSNSSNIPTAQSLGSSKDGLGLRPNPLSGRGARRVMNTKFPDQLFSDVVARPSYPRTPCRLEESVAQAPEKSSSIVLTPPAPCGRIRWSQGMNPGQRRCP